MHCRQVAHLVSVYRRWRTVPCDRTSDETRIAPQIRLASSSGRYPFWGRSVPNRFQKRRSVRFGRASSPCLRGASRVPFVSRAFSAFLSSTLDRPRQVTALSVCWRLHCKICHVSRTPWELSKGPSRKAFPQNNFCKAKDKERGAPDPLRPYKAHKGTNYGIPDLSCRRSNDGALCVNHSRLPETARMVRPPPSLFNIASGRMTMSRPTGHYRWHYVLFSHVACKIT